ncbi:hypothetical protein L3Q82_018790, partial [Scortum barcoo]
MLLRNQSRMKAATDRHRRPAPAYRLGQKVWLSTKDLPLHVHSRKLAPRSCCAVRKRGRGRQFLVNWEGYGPEERSWIPASFIVDDKLIDDFYQCHPEAPGPSGAGPKGGVLLCLVKSLNFLPLCVSLVP